MEKQLIEGYVTKAYSSICLVSRYNKKCTKHTPCYSLIAPCSFPLEQLGQQIVIHMIITLMSVSLDYEDLEESDLSIFAHQGVLWC